MKPHNCANGSAWHDWQTAGHEWRQKTYATSKGALLVAATAFASKARGETERHARKCAFIEGATLTRN